MKRKRFSAAITSLVMVASMAAVPFSANAATSYTSSSNLIKTGGTGSSNKVEVAGVTVGKETNKTLTSYNATEFKKVLEIEDTANIPAVTFDYTITFPNSETPATYDNDGTLKTLAVFAGINPWNISYKLENVNDNTFVTNANTSYVASANNSNLISNNVTTSGSESAGFTLKYSPQSLLGTTGNISATVSSGTTMAASPAGTIGDNVVINNITAESGKEDTYYAIKTVQLDFSVCGFTEPGIYRYYITESGANQGVTNDYPVVGDDNCKRTIDVYVEDATYTEDGTTTNDLRIAGYVMYVGHQTAGPAAGEATSKAPTAATLEDGLTHTNPSGNGGANGVEVSNATKSEGIKNIYKTSDITFAKTVTGNQASKDKYFKFTIKLTDDATEGNTATTKNVADTDMFAITGTWDKTVSAGTFTNGKSGAPNAATPYEATEISNASNKSVDSLSGKDVNETLSAENKYGNNVIWLTGAQLKAGYSFYLQDAHNITIHGLPNGIGYELTEFQDDYTPKVQVLKSQTEMKEGESVVTHAYDNSGVDKDGNSVSVLGAADDAFGTNGLNISNQGSNITANNASAQLKDTKIEADVSATFQNERKGTIPTGVLLSVAAPAIVGIIVIGGIVFLILKNKRREAEEE